MIVEVAGEDLVGGRDDQVRQRSIEQAAFGVLERGRLLEQGERVDDLHRHPLRGRVADREVMQ